MKDAPHLPVPPMKWDAWGDPNRVTALSAAQLGMVHDLLEVSADDVEAVPYDEVLIRPPQLSDADRDALATIVGAEHVSTADADRLPRAGGKSTLDLLRRKSRAEQDAPDAVVLPGTDDEVAAVLA